jgi:hypothetical protein
MRDREGKREMEDEEKEAGEEDKKENKKGAGARERIVWEREQRKDRGTCLYILIF